jgi:thioesterase domain-containing protein
MVPSMCLMLKSFPQTPSGKVDRNALPAPDWSRVPTAALASPIEGLLATVIELWQEILDIPGLQPSSDFFALGGDSLHAMRLASKIESRLCHTVPIVLLLQHRTAEKFALALQEAFEHEELSRLLLIRDGGRRKPLFFIHPIFGDVWGYRNLADALEYDQAIYGVQARGLDGTLPPHQTIEECAADYISLIQSVQTHGPYVLAGYSSGGLIAYEMACQLVSLGEEVDFLGLIDTGVPPKLEARLDWMNPQHVGRFVWNVAMAVASLRYCKPMDIPRIIVLSLGRALAKLWPGLGRRAAGVAAARPGADLPQYFYFGATNLTVHRLELIRTHLHAIESFVPRAYPGHVSLFRSERSPIFNPQGPLLGWERVPMGSIEATKVKGIHLNMLDAAYVGLLAQCISQSLRARHKLVMMSMAVCKIFPEFSPYFSGSL